jgi:hypothetical protein
VTDDVPLPGMPDPEATAPEHDSTAAIDAAAADLERAVRAALDAGVPLENIDGIVYAATLAEP